MQVKKCTKCGQEKGFDEFGKHKRCKYGLYSICKACKNEDDKKYREENKEKINEYRKKYYEENKEHCKEWHKKYYEENKEHCKEWHKKYYEENKEYSKKYYEENKEKQREYSKKYCKENKIQINGEMFNINTAPEEIKESVENLIIIRNLRKEIKLKKNKLLEEINDGKNI